MIDVAKVPERTGAPYPGGLAAEMEGRSSRRLGDAGGLTQFAANLWMLAPGAKSSLRHWHAHEDEFVMVTEGELVLVEDAGETVLRAGDCAAFPAGVPNGHHFVNRTGAAARFLAVGTRAEFEVVTYSDIDMRAEFRGEEARFTRRDGSALETG